MVCKPWIWWIPNEENCEGLEQGLNVSIYANPEFNCSQLNVIFEGLNEGLDVSSYANPEYSLEKMQRIRFKLEDENDL